MLAAGVKPCAGGGNKLHHWGETRAECAISGALGPLKHPDFAFSVNNRFLVLDKDNMPQENPDKKTEPCAWLMGPMVFVETPRLRGPTHR